NAHARLMIWLYTRRRRLALALDPFDLTADRQWALQSRNRQLKNKNGTDVERLLGANECAALANVLGVVCKKHIDPLVFDFELDRRARIFTAFVFTRRLLRHCQAGPYLRPGSTSNRPCLRPR